MTDVPALEVSGLHVRHGDVLALRGIDLTVAPGECCAVLGPSGCGKTTLLRTIAGLVPAQRGRIAIGGRETDAPGSLVAPEDRRAALVFQDLALWPHMSVAGNIDFVLEARGVRRKERPAVVDRVRADVGLPEALLLRRPGELSGGERQRAALARALAQDPRILLLDEPLTGLDRHLRHRLLHTLAGLRAERRIATLVVTHDQEEAFALADRVAVLRDGVVEQEGTPEEIYARPATEFVADFVGAAALLPAERVDDAVVTALGTFPAPDAPGGPLCAVFRPEGVHEVESGGVPATVVDAFYRGGHVLVRAATEAGEHVLVRSSRRPARGSRLVLRADPPALVPAKKETR